ncbi:MAG: PAS domain-containing protein [Gemmatimonas sp.]|nr:PAS domain-containing protein [Gemmatimonas sp.]
MNGDRPEAGLSRWLAILSLLSVLPGLAGLLLGMPRLAQPLNTFAPARVGEAMLVSVAALGLLAKLEQKRLLARALAVAGGLLALYGLYLSIRGYAPPMDPVVARRLGKAYGGGATHTLPITVSALFLLYSIALLLLSKEKHPEQTLVMIGALASSQVALAGVMFTTQLAGVIDGTAVQPLRAPLFSLLSALALGLALLEQLARREQTSVAPPRWAPMLAGVSSALVVLVLWQALLAREASQLQARSAITAEAVNRAVQRQYAALVRTMGRVGANLSASTDHNEPLWSVGLPRLIADMHELKHVLWFDGSGTLLHSASPQSLPADVLAELSTHIRTSNVRSRLFAAHSTTMHTGAWHLALWWPVLSPTRGATVLVALVDEVDMIRLFAEDASREFSLRVRAGDTLLLRVGDTEPDALPFVSPLAVGARQLTLDVSQRPGVLRAPLPDVVLALGLTVSVLLALTLWLQRRNWLQAHAEGRRFRAVFETAFQVQLLLDANGTVLEANRAAGKLAECDPDALAGKSLWKVPWWNEDQVTEARVHERFNRALAGETQRFEVEIGRGRDRALTLDFSLKPVLDALQKTSQVIVEGRDLTIRKRAEESMREMSALTTMGRLAARVAHEINNPLAGIQNSFLLIRGAIPTDHPHYRFVGAIEREISRIAAVTRQLYETYRPDQSTVAASSVILAVSDAVSFLEQVNRNRNVRIVANTAQAPSLVPVPDALLRQTLYNLVQNAMDVSPSGGTVTVSAVQEDDECVLRVSDDGPGIPAAIRERIFDPFFSTKDRTMKTGGMGIGLALVRQSVLAVGGQITVHDRASGGTEFEVRLPMTPLDTGALR